MSDSGFSVLRVELERAKLSFVAMLTDAMVARDQEVKDAIERALTPDALAAVVEREVRRAVDEAVRDEVDRFYRYGAGRAAVRAAVVERLTP